MLKVDKFTQVFGDCVKSLKIHGKILKIVVETKELSPNIDLEIKTEDQELLWKGNLQDKITTIYPINVIKEVDVNLNYLVNEIEPQLVTKELFSDYFYSLGSVGFKFENIEQGQCVKQVKVIYEGVVDNGSKSWNFN